jgi:hypothetical protein
LRSVLRPGSIGAGLLLAAASLTGLGGCGGTGSTNSLGADLAKSVSRTVAGHVAALAARENIGTCHDLNVAACQAAATFGTASYAPLGPCRPATDRPGYNWSCALNSSSSASLHTRRTRFLINLTNSRCWVEVDAASPTAYDSHLRGCLAARTSHHN